MSLKDVVVVLLTHPLQRSSNDLAAVQVGVIKPIGGIELAIGLYSVVKLLGGRGAIWFRSSSLVALRKPLLCSVIARTGPGCDARSRRCGVSF